MKALLSVIIAGLLFSACGSNSSDKPAAEADSATIEAVYHWNAEINDSTTRLEMKKADGVGPDSLSIPAVIDFLNKDNPNVKLDFVKQSNDTLFIKIADSEKLTQQMGSTGATMYMAEAVYNLTEIPGIKYVQFDFEEGDHAQPGTYGRENFKDE